MPVERRRFPPPWSVEDTNGACYVIRNLANGIGSHW
jgi:hypothetical protein